MVGLLEVLVRAIATVSSDALQGDTYSVAIEPALLANLVSLLVHYILSPQKV